MSHLIEEGIDTVYTPQGTEFEDTWHGLQTALQGGIQTTGDNAPEVFCPIVECGVKADFEGVIVSTEGIESEAQDELKNWKLILADCRKGISGKVIPLHVPKKGYRIHQNKALFDCMIQSCNQVLGDGNYTIATLGTLGGYSQFFVSISVKGHESFSIGSDDKWNRFFNLNSSHNGLISSHRMLSLVRIVCSNTLQASISDAESSDSISKIKHTANSDMLITPEVFAKDLQTWIARGENFKQLLESIKSESMTVDQFKAFSAGVFTQAKSDELSTNSYNRIEDMTGLFQRGKGNTGETRYDALNAFTEYFTSGNGVGSKDVSMGKRIASANFGRGNQWKIEAIRTLANPEVFADTVKRGEILYTDKLAVMASAN
jgi:hypothetical protein